MQYKKQITNSAPAVLSFGHSGGTQSQLGHDLIYDADHEGYLASTAQGLMTSPRAASLIRHARNWRSVLLRLLEQGLRNRSLLEHAQASLKNIFGQQGMGSRPRTDTEADYQFVFRMHGLLQLPSFSDQQGRTVFSWRQVRTLLYLTHRWGT
jgi:hypothetical protein